MLFNVYAKLFLVDLSKSFACILQCPDISSLAIFGSESGTLHIPHGGTVSLADRYGFIGILVLCNVRR